MQYDYICSNCKKQFSVFAKIGTIDIKTVNCPSCKSFDVARKWLPVHVHFHADGFTKKIKEKN